MASTMTAAGERIRRARRRARGSRVWAHKIERPFRLATLSRRPLPDFLVIGAAKAGTTSLYRYIWPHPDVRKPWRKEPHFFDLRYERGEDWYRAQFPLIVRSPRTWITGEATPYYLHHPLVPDRVKLMLPDAKLIVLLRDPVERAFSHWRHNVRMGAESRSFESAIESERENYDEVEELMRTGDREAVAEHRMSYIARGRYAEQLERWFERFPRERFLILQSEQFFEAPGDAYKQVLAFLGLASFSGVAFEIYNKGVESPLDPEVRARLVDDFREPNRRLYELLGTDFGWPV